jgi:hypothetical protein
MSSRMVRSSKLASGAMIVEILIALSGSCILRAQDATPPLQPTYIVLSQAHVLLQTVCAGNGKANRAVHPWRQHCPGENFSRT